MDNADFEVATFKALAHFDQATLPNTPYTGSESPEPWTDFNGAQFGFDLPPEVEQFVSRPEEAGEGGEAG